MRRIHVCACAALLLLAAAGSPRLGAQLKVEEAEPAIVREGSGGTSLLLTNESKKPVPLKLMAGVFADQTSHLRIAAAKVTFATEATGETLPATLAAGQQLRVDARVASLTGSLVAWADLYNDGLPVGRLDAVAVDVPLNVVLSGPGTPEEKLVYPYQRSAIVTIKNLAKEFVTLDYRFLIGGTVEKVDTIALAPNATGRIFIPPSPEVYAPVDFLRPGTAKGVLLLHVHTPANLPKGLLATQAIPVTLQMRRLGPDWTNFYFAVYVMALLLLGGALSLTASSVLPNILRKVGIERQLSDLADRTSSVSTRVDSYLRVLLRLERKKVEMALKEVGLLTLSASERLDDVAKGLERLNRRLDVAERLDELRRCFEIASATAPPSAVDALDRVLQLAADQLHSFALPEENVNTARAELEKADAALTALDDAAAQARQVAANFRELQERLKNFPAADYADLARALSGVFTILDEPFDDPGHIVSPMMFAIDHAIAAAQLTLDYAMVRATIAGGTWGDGPRARLLEREGELIGLLGTLSWKALRAATMLVRQMREDVYEEDVLRELARKRADGRSSARIVFDTQRARPYLPVYFSLDFDDPRFAGAAALDGLLFRWRFPGNLTEEGVKVCHYFEGAEPDVEDRNGKNWMPGVDGEAGDAQRRRGKHKQLRRRVRRIGITVEVQSPHNMDATETLEGVIELQPRKVQDSPRAFVELVRFLIAFGVALAGLEAGALEQLAKLDFLPATIAVIALGFGADSIKNLLTQGTKKAG